MFSVRPREGEDHGRPRLRDSWRTAGSLPARPGWWRWLNLGCVFVVFGDVPQLPVSHRDDDRCDLIEVLGEEEQAEVHEDVTRPGS